MSKTHWKKNFNYEYLGTYSLDEGKDKTLTIKETKVTQVTGQNGKKEECFTCYFKQDEKPMILNRTNCKIIEALYGEYVEDWVGKNVTIYSAKVDAFGSSTTGLRIRNKIPVTKLPTLTIKNKNWDKIVDKIKTNEATIESLKTHFVMSEETESQLIEALV